MRALFRTFRSLSESHSASSFSAGDRTELDLVGKSFASLSRWHSGRSDNTGALSSAIDAIECGSVIGKFGGVWARYSAQSCQLNGLEEIERLYPKLTSEGLSNELARVRRIRQQWPTIADTLERERQEQSAACRAYLKNLSEHGPLDQYETLFENSQILFRFGRIEIRNYFDFGTWGKVLTPHRAVLAAVDRYYDELIEASRHPAPRGVPVPKVSNPIAAFYCDSSFSGQYRGEWARHNLAIAEVALAVRLYHLTNHRYPKALGEIPRSMLPEVPVDVWGRPILYRLKNGRPLVYSAGADGRDEGGKAVDPSTHIRGRGGDLVFGKLASSHWQARR